MTNILALDTSGTCCSIALLRQTTPDKNAEVIARVHDAPREHTQRILPMIDELLADAELSLTQLDALAFGRGPGSFTGLRIALSVVQGLAYGANVPVVPVSTLQALAQQAYRKNWASLGDKVCTALDARMSEVYMAAYEIRHNAPQLLVPEQVLVPEDALAAWQPILETPSSNIKAIGDGWCLEALCDENITIERNPDAVKATPLAEDIAPLALDAFKKGQIVDAMQAEPVYLRNEVTWKKRQRIRNV